MGSPENFFGALMGKIGLSRRGFIKGSVSAGAAAALMGCSKDGDETILLQTGNSDTESSAPAEEKKYSSPCRSNCQSNCRLWAHVRNGRVVKTSMAPFFPPSGMEYDQVTGEENGPISAEDAEKAYNSYNRACLRGLSSVQRLYSPSRILYPMRQTGERGDVSAFKRITWEEALEAISSKIAELYDPDPAVLGSKICTFTASGNYGALHGHGGAPKLIGNILNTRTMWTSLDMSLPVGLSKVFGTTTFPFLTGNELRDIQNAKTLILWGSNMADAHMMGWRFVCDGKVSAGKGGHIENVVSIDVMANTTSVKSDYMYIIKPASDTIVALSMINDIIARGLQNDAFLAEHTVAPFLVNTATYAFVRARDLDGYADDDLNFVMWDADNDAPVVTENNNPALTALGAGKYTTPSGVSCDMSGTPRVLTGKDGGAITAITAFGMLKMSVARWTPEAAEEYTNISPDNLRRLVDMYASGPSTIYLGFGTSHHFNSHHFGHAVATLGAITGNVGGPGRSVGNFFTRIAETNSYPSPSTRLNGTTNPAPYIMPPQLATDIREGVNQVKMLLVASANPVSNYVNSINDYIKTVIPAMDMIVVHDMEMTETARYADIVLPAAHWWEVYEYFSGSKHPFVVLQEKIFEPMGEALSDMDFARLLSVKLDEKIAGLEAKKWFCVDEDASKPFKTDLDFIRQCSSRPTAKRVTYDRLMKEKVIRGRHPNDMYIAMKDDTYGIKTSGCVSHLRTPGGGSGRLEFYNEFGVPFINWYGSLVSVMGKINQSAELLPTWVEPAEAWSGPTENAEQLALRDNYPLIYMQEHPRWRVHTQWTEVPWLRELDPEPVVKICPADAEKYGIQAGDTVKVSNGRGFAVFKAMVVGTLPEGIINAPKGWQRHLYNPSYTYDDGTPGSYNDMTSPKFDPVGIDHIFYDSRVKIEKLG